MSFNFLYWQRTAALRLINNKNDESVINYSVQTTPQFQMNLNRKNSTVYVGINANGEQVFSFFNVTVDLLQIPSSKIKFLNRNYYEKSFSLF